MLPETPQKIHLLGYITIFLILIGLATLRPVLVVMAIPFVIYLISGVVTAPGEIDLEIRRSLSTERSLPGGIVEVKLTVINHGSDLRGVFCEDFLSPNLTLEDGSPRHIIDLSRGNEVTWRYAIRGKRGYYRFASLNVTTRDQFGINIRQHILPTGGQLLVLPPVIKLKHISIRPRKTRVYAGEIPARSGGEGVEFFGIRQYQSGDAPNRINWRISARHTSSLYSNQFEQERVADVGIILDGRERSNPLISGSSIYEHSVLAAATLANAFLSQGDRVSLLHYGKYIQWTLPGYGKFQRERILRALTQVEPGRSLVFAYLRYLPTRLFPPQSQIVLISPLHEDDAEVLLQIRAHGYRVLVISPDPVSFEESLLPPNLHTRQASRILSMNRKLLLRQLLNGGIRVVDWNVNLPFDQVVSNLSKPYEAFRALEVI